MSIAGSARQASRSVLHLRPPLFSASAASFSGLRPSNSGSGIRRSPFASASPPSPRIASNARKCCVVPRRPVAPSMTMPIVRLGIGLLLYFYNETVRQRDDAADGFAALNPSYKTTKPLLAVSLPHCEFLLHGGG